MLSTEKLHNRTVIFTGGRGTSLAKSITSLLASLALTQASPNLESKNHVSQEPYYRRFERKPRK